MLAKRIIPCLDVRDGIVVKGKKFKDIKEVADPVTLGKKYSDEGADELVFYDITATNEKRDIFLDVIKDIARNINIPFTIGGGIRTLDDFAKVLGAGADKVSINSSAIRTPNLIKEAALKYGNQCVVLSMDVKKNGDKWEVYLNGGREATGLDAIEWAIKGVSLGAGEIVINSIDSDGVKGGFDLEINKLIGEAVSVPIIASGGAGSIEDFYEVFNVSNVDGALAASVFHYDEIKIKDLKKYLADKKIQIRE